MRTLKRLTVKCGVNPPFFLSVLSLLTIILKKISYFLSVKYVCVKCSWEAFD